MYDDENVDLFLLKTLHSLSMHPYKTVFSPGWPKSIEKNEFAWGGSRLIVLKIGLQTRIEVYINQHTSDNVYDWSSWSCGRLDHVRTHIFLTPVRSRETKTNKQTSNPDKIL